MSQENVELVRAMLAAFERGDLPALFAHYDPEIEWDVSRMTVAGALAAPVYRGFEGIRQFWREYASAWGSIEFTYEQLFDAGDAVVVAVRQRARGRASGVELETSQYAQVWTLRRGKVLRMDMFPTLAQALEAVGWGGVGGDD